MLFILEVIPALTKEWAFGKLLVNIKGSTHEVTHFETTPLGSQTRIEMTLSNGDHVQTFASYLDEGPNNAMIYGHDLVSDRPFVLVLNSKFNIQGSDDEDEEDTEN